MFGTWTAAPPSPRARRPAAGATTMHRRDTSAIRRGDERVRRAGAIRRVGIAPLVGRRTHRRRDVSLTSDDAGTLCQPARERTCSRRSRSSKTFLGSWATIPRESAQRARRCTRGASEGIRDDACDARQPHRVHASARGSIVMTARRQGRSPAFTSAARAERDALRRRFAIDERPRADARRALDASTSIAARSRADPSA